MRHSDSGKMGTVNSVPKQHKTNEGYVPDQNESRGQEQGRNINQEVTEESGTGRQRRINLGNKLSAARRIIRSDYIDIFLKVLFSFLFCTFYAII